jgi:peptidoglycan hydrolase-like protein with peptidoglycan-binding domain
MAYTIARMLKIDSDSPSQDLPDYWQLNFPVSPQGSASKTDVMLVQALLVVYSLSDVPRSNDKLEAMQILRSQRGRFDDGIYGPRTRALLKIFENQFLSPVKDGIVRPSSWDDLQSN